MRPAPGSASPNVRLASQLALRSMRSKPVLSLATTFGVALGMMVVGSILIVDHNSRHTQPRTKNLETAILSLAPGSAERVRLSVRFERHAERPSLLATLPPG